MGKGDKKTRRGKITNKSYGKHRMRKASEGYAAPAKVEEEKVETQAPVVKKRAVKKTTATKKATTTKPKAEAKAEKAE